MQSLRSLFVPAVLAAWMLQAPGLTAQETGASEPAEQARGAAPEGRQGRGQDPRGGRRFGGRRRGLTVP